MKSTVTALVFALTLSGLGRVAAAQPEYEVKPERAAGCRTAVRPPAPRSKEFSDAIKVLPPERGAYTGLYSIGTTRADYREAPKKVGYTPPILFTFHDWVSDADYSKAKPKLRTFEDALEGDSTTVLQMANDIQEKGSVLAVTWALQCCNWSSTLWWFGFGQTEITVTRLLKGDFDNYIRTVARQVKAFAKPIMLTLFSEFNTQGAFLFGEKGNQRIDDVDHICKLYGDATLPDGPERVRDAFMKVIDMFRAEGVKNVTWFMYATSRYMDPQHKDYSPWLHPKFFYPGDGYMDWVGQSAYFVDPSWTDVVTEDLSVIARALKPGYDAWGQITQRPLFLPEFGASGKPDIDRSAVIRDVMSNYLPTMPRVKAFTLADFRIAEVCCAHPRLGARFAQEIAAWRKGVAQNPYYQKQLRTGAPAP